MRTLLYKSVIHDIDNHGCTEQEVARLCDIFALAIKKAEGILAHTLIFDMKDNHYARTHHVSAFSLILKRSIVQEQKQWHGMFVCHNKRLSLLGALEKD